VLVGRLDVHQSIFVLTANGGLRRVRIKSAVLAIVMRIEECFACGIHCVSEEFAVILEETERRDTHWSPGLDCFDFVCGGVGVVNGMVPGILDQLRLASEASSWRDCSGLVSAVTADAKASVARSEVDDTIVVIVDALDALGALLIFRWAGHDHYIHSPAGLPRKLPKICLLSPL
jgi:hypothetical protein